MASPHDAGPRPLYQLVELPSLHADRRSLRWWIARSRAYFLPVLLGILAAIIAAKYAAPGSGLAMGIDAVSRVVLLNLEWAIAACFGYGWLAAFMEEQTPGWQQPIEPIGLSLSDIQRRVRAKRPDGSPLELQHSEGRGGLFVRWLLVSVVVSALITLAFRFRVVEILAACLVVMILMDKGMERVDRNSHRVALRQSTKAADTKIDEAIAKGKTHYVTYLRSFRDDGEGGDVPPSLALMKLTSQIIAIAPPRESLPPLIGRQIYVGDDAWQAKVRSWISASDGIVVSVGGASDGIRWELRNVLEDGEARDKTVFILSSPCSSEERNMRWNGLAKIAGDPGFNTLLAVTADKGLLAVVLRRNSPAIGVVGRADVAEDYGRAALIGLYLATERSPMEPAVATGPAR